MALRDRRGTKRLPPAGRIGLGEKVFYCKNSNCPRSKGKSPKNPIVNTKDDVVACPDCGTKHRQNQIKDFPRATDHFVFPYVPNPGVADLWAVFGDQCQDLPIIFPFPNIDDNVDAHYKIWAGGVNVCKGDGVEVCMASPMRVVKEKEGTITRVYNQEGPDLVRGGVALCPFSWGEFHFEPGDPVPCPGSHQWEEDAQVYPQCAACKRNVRMQFLIAHPDAIDVRHWWINTSSGAAHDRFFTILELIRDLNRRNGGSVAGIVFHLTLALEPVAYHENGKRKTTTKWLMSLVPPPEVMAALFQQQAQNILVAGEAVPMIEAPDDGPPDDWGDEMGIVNGVIEGEFTGYEEPPPPPQANDEAAVNDPEAAALDDGPETDELVQAAIEGLGAVVVDEIPEAVQEAMDYTTSKGTRLGDCDDAQLGKLLEWCDTTDSTEAQEVGVHIVRLIDYRAAQGAEI